MQTFADFGQIRESLSRKKFESPRFGKVYVREIFQNRSSAKINVLKKFHDSSYIPQIFYGHGKNKKNRNLFLTIHFYYKMVCVTDPLGPPTRWRKTSQTRWDPLPAGEKLQKSARGRKKWPKFV